MKSVLFLSTAQIKSIINSFWRGSLNKKLGLAIIGGCLGVAWVAWLPIIWPTLVQLSRGEEGEMVVSLEAGLYLLVSFTFITAVGFALASLYFAADIEMLFSMPIKEKAIIWQRIVAQIAIGLGFGVVLLGPVLVAMGIITHNGWAVIIIGVILLLMMIIPILLGILFVSLLIYVIPQRVLRVLLPIITVAVMGISGGVTYLFHGKAVGLRMINGISDLTPGGLMSGVSPLHWAAKAISGVWRGQWGVVGVAGVELAGVVAVLAGGVVYLGALLYRRNWEKIQAAPFWRRRDGKRLRIKHWMIAIVEKDLITLERDAAQIGQLLLPFGLFCAYAFVSSLPGNRGAGFQGFPLWYGPLLTALFSSVFINSGLGLRLIGIEGQNFWNLRSSPLSLSKLLMAKSVLPVGVALMGSILLMLINDGRDGLQGFEVEFAAVILWILVSGTALMALGFGALFADFQWKDPRRVIPVWAGATYIVASVLFVGVSVVGFTLVLLGLSLPLGAVVADLLAIGFCLAMTILFGGGMFWIGYRRLALMDI